jgi:uncharacterized protein (DUF169 family)
MLVNMGIFGSLEAGKKAMETMTRIPMGTYKYIKLQPLNRMDSSPDVVVIESVPEHLMWLALASIYETGERLHFNTAVFQAACVDSTIIPLLSGKMNVSLSCYGCREATNIEESECLLGLPYNQLESLTNNLERMSTKPIVKARSKGAYHSLTGCEG